MRITDIGSSFISRWIETAIGVKVMSTCMALIPYAALILSTVATVGR